MKKLAVYLKPYIFLIIICIALLFGQAMCDLSLPNLMSDIVNTGIQQNGVEDAAPKAISQNGYKLMGLLMSDDQKTLVNENYSLVEKSNKQDFETYVDKYPLLNKESIYVLKTKDKNKIQELNRCFSESSFNIISFLKSSAKTSTGSNSGQMQDVSKEDFNRIYNLIPVIESLPPTALQELKKTSNNVDDSMLEQTSLVFTRQFYSELGVDINNMQSNYIIRTGIYMLILTLIGAIATIIVGLLGSRIAASVAKHMRRDVFEKVESFSNLEFDKFSTASLITRTTNDITQIQTLIVMGIRMLCYSPILGIGGIIMAANNSSSMTWIIALGVIVLIGLISVIFIIAMPKFKLVQKLVDKLNLVTRENLSGMMVIRAFGTQKFEEKRFDEVNKDLTKTNLFINRVISFMMPAMMFIMNSISLLIVWVGGHQIAESTMQVGNMMAFIQYAMQIIMSFLMISMMFILIPRATVSGDRIQEVLSTEPSILDPENPRELGKHFKGTVEFKNVSFKYHNADDSVLENITFTAKPGETTAFIGSTGSGKSTLINLIPRFYDVTDGEILVDGVNIKSVTQHELRENIGFVPQKGVLFSGNIESNIRYSTKNATEEDVKNSAQVAQAIDFINSTKDGFNTEISQGGTNVSGGQKQRLAIARALVKKAPIYIFDDSFSALDFKTDAVLRKALKEYTGSSAVLIVAQRISTIMNAEQIIVLDEGRIVGMGTHKQLLENCNTYKEIAKSQLSEEELQ